MSLAAFAAASLVILITPGPTNTLLAASGAAFGLARGLLLPLAEALGYALAIGGFLLATAYLSEVHLMMPALKAVAACWLLISAVQLWRQPVRIEPAAAATAFRRVFVTTLLNPKAMLVGTIVIPALMKEKPAGALVCFLALAVAAGFAWLAMGSMLPVPARPYAYKAAALVLGAFSFVAASGSLQG